MKYRLVTKLKRFTIDQHLVLVLKLVLRLAVIMLPQLGRGVIVRNMLTKSFSDHIQFVLLSLYYVYPVEYHSDDRRWIGGIVRNQKNHSANLHNHPLHGNYKICNLVQDKISNAIQTNPSLTPTDISLGRGIGFIPSAIDSASAHQGKLAREVAKTRIALGLKDKNWSPCSLEEAVTLLDNDDNQNCDDVYQEEKYQNYGRPYLVSSGIENGINYSVTMSPLMAKILSEALAN